MLNGLTVITDNPFGLSCGCREALYRPNCQPSPTTPAVSAVSDRFVCEGGMGHLLCLVTACHRRLNGAGPGDFDAFAGSLKSTASDMLIDLAANALASSRPFLLSIR